MPVPTEVHPFQGWNFGKKLLSHTPYTYRSFSLRLLHIFNELQEPSHLIILKYQRLCSEPPSFSVCDIHGTGHRMNFDPTPRCFSEGYYHNAASGIALRKHESNPAHPGYPGIKLQSPLGMVRGASLQPTSG